jgi:uncharacterized protein (TIGR03492 family)
VSTPDILLVSNGFGEAAIAGYIAAAIKHDAPDAQIEHLPLVWSDAAQTGADRGALRTVGPTREMPSGGLVAYWNFGNLFRDLRAGLFGLTLRQYAFLRRQRKRGVIVAVGDVYCLAACRLFAGRPTIFVATAKSQHVAPHSALEYSIARGAVVTFARDAATAQALREHGVRAQYAGNLMMDGLTAHETDLPVRADAIRFGILPGSRSDADENAATALRRVRMLAAALKTRARSVQAYLSIAPSIGTQAILAASERAGLPLTPTAARSGIIARGAAENLEVIAVSGAFGDLVRASQLVIGQAGTGNEQAAGLGRPVIAWTHGTGDSGWYRMRQQRLLGDALLVLPDDDSRFCDGVIALLDDPARMAAMADLGRERMGEPGGTAVVAKAVLAQASQRSRQMRSGGNVGAG